MEFVQTIIEKIGSLFDRYSIEVVEKRDDYLKLKSPCLIMRIVHNSLEKSNTLWIGRNGNGNEIEVDNDVLFTFFKLEMKLSQVTMTNFISNLRIFIDEDPRGIFSCNPKVLRELEEYHLIRSHRYTKQLLDKQKLQAAIKAWDDGNYRRFVNLLDELSDVDLPKSFKLKYQIAQEHIR